MLLLSLANAMTAKGIKHKSSTTNPPFILIATCSKQVDSSPSARVMSFGHKETPKD